MIFVIHENKRVPDKVSLFPGLFKLGFGDILGLSSLGFARFVPS